MSALQSKDKEHKDCRSEKNVSLHLYPSLTRYSEINM